MSLLKVLDHTSQIGRTNYWFSENDKLRQEDPHSIYYFIEFFL